LLLRTTYPAQIIRRDVVSAGEHKSYKFLHFSPVQRTGLEKPVKHISAQNRQNYNNNKKKESEILTKCI